MSIADDRAYASLLKTARARFKAASEADDEQRTRELEDLQFYAGDQWPSDVKNARKAQAASGTTPAIPARPCITVNKARQPVQIVINEERQSEIGVEILPADDFADAGVVISDEEITLREGLVRRIQRETDAAAARSWAFSRATIAGRGYYAVMTRYLPGKTSDQEVYVQRIYNQDSVRLDPAHEEPDGSDCEYQFIGTWMPLDVYKATYPNSPQTPNRISAGSDGDFGGWASDDTTEDWVKLNGELRAVYVVDYYYFDRTSRSLTEFEDGTAEWTDQIAENDPRPVTGTRTVVEKTAKWCKIDGINDRPLEETAWPSPYLPIIKVLGEELHPYDHERRAEGMVRPMRGSGEGFNAMASKLVEVVAYAPIAPIVGPAGFDEGFEEEWDLSATRSIPRLHYNLEQGPDGQPAPPPSATPRDAPIAPIAAALQMFDAGVKTTTGVPDPTLGNVDPALKSGRAIAQLQDQSRLGTSNFMDNLERAVRHEGRIVNSLLYPIYGQRPQRLVRIVTGEGDSQPIVIGHPFSMQGGRPQLAQQSPAPAQSKLYTLSPDAHFNVVIKVTKNYDTRREQQNAILSQIVGNDPQQMMVVGDLLYASMEDLPAHQEMSERAQLMLAPPIQAAIQAKKTGQPPIPPQVQQELAQAKQGTQALMARLQELEQKIAGKVVEQQGKLAVVQAQESYDLLKSREANETKIAVAELGAKVDRLALFLEERARLGSQSHDAAMATADAGHDQLMAQMGGQQAAAASAQDHGQTLDQQSQAAALTPQPQGDGDGGANAS